LALAGIMARGQDLPKDSPFLPPAANAASAAVSSKYQLAGMIVQGKETMISVTRLSDKQSFWIPIGSTVNEVTAVSYNPDQDEAKVRANGETLILPLRKPVVQTASAAAASTSAAIAYATAPAVTPPLPSLASASPEVQEREARMLVTDLLDIGQQQRKAYEEAQKKAAADKK
jgi:hypothetical protein